MSAKKATKEKPFTKGQWKDVALTLARQVNFAINYLVPRGGGSGILFNVKTGEQRHWKEDAADALEKIPGVKIDREVMHLMSLPNKQRSKAIEALNKRRATAQREAAAAVPAGK